MLMENWLTAENKPDAQNLAYICQALGDESTECWTLGRFPEWTGKPHNWSGMNGTNISKLPSQKNTERYRAARSEVYNDIRQQPG